MVRVLESRSPSTHNVMVGRATKSSSPLKRFLTTEPPSKRRKLSVPDDSQGEEKPDEDGQEDGDTSLFWRSSSPKPTSERQIPDSDADSEDEEIDKGENERNTRTDLEQAMPAIKTDRQAIQEYEILRSSQTESATQLKERLGQREWVVGKSSIYVDAFNLALETVMEEEAHLFDEAEQEVFDQWRVLSYEAQYLYVRLFLRKTSAWHRVSRLRYYSDIADMQRAVQELFQQRQLPETTEHEQITPGELAPPEGTTLTRSFSFADNSDDAMTTLEEASSLLLLEELKSFAKEAKVHGKNKTELLRSFRRTSGRQTSLGFASLSRNNTEDTEEQDTPTPRELSPVKGGPPVNANRDEYWIRKILEETGQCIRLSLASNKLFERVHLVFYRSTEWTEKSLTTIILARIARLNFPKYVVSRSANIYPSRSMLLEYEAALRTQFRIDNILEFNGTPTKDTLEVVLDIFEEVYPRWRVLLAEEQRKEDSIYLSGEGAYLRRLSPAWIYTRIVHKGAFVLGMGKFKDHKREHSTLRELLDQRLFHAARRGAWYQRKALLEEHYMGDLSSNEGRSVEEQKKHWKRTAARTCEEGLEDNLVHVIFHYDLQKRLTKLEKSLKIPKRLQHEFGHSQLTKPIERTIEGIRVEKPPRLVRSNSERKSSATIESRRGGKTIWVDNREGGGECSVEAMCLSWYREQGWKGYHSEGGIVRTLFALLLFDVLFTYVPNVFQTPYQACPLDLHTDAFYPTRMSEINARLADIANGKAAAIIRSTWTQESENKTCVVGLDWNFELDDILEIVSCLRGEQLATLCKVIAEEYGERGGGVPDLFLWHVERRECCFAEVKSENDRLSDTQRQWIHVLSGAGIRVELALAVAKETRVMHC